MKNKIIAGKEKTMDLVSFYKGTGTDHAGRRLEDVLSFNDHQLEDVHDYIQWMFPLPEKSAYQPHVPTLTANDVAAFKADSKMQDNLRRSFNRILSFYGLEDDGEIVAPAANVQERINVWLTPRNHNFLRITRILKSMTMLGLEDEAQRFFHCLDELNRHPQAKAIIGNSHEYWKQQVNLPKPQGGFSGPKPS